MDGVRGGGGGGGRGVGALPVIDGEGTADELVGAAGDEEAGRVEVAAADGVVEAVPVGSGVAHGAADGVGLTAGGVEEVGRHEAVAEAAAGFFKVVAFLEQRVDDGGVAEESGQMEG